MTVNNSLLSKFIQWMEAIVAQWKSDSKLEGCVGSIPTQTNKIFSFCPL